MELRHLRYFMVLAEELHFTRAAERLNIAPPTLTVQIQEIERRLGTQLLVRNRRSVALTDEGKIFLDEARDVIARFERAETVGRRAGKGQIGRLLIGYVGTVAYAGVLQDQVRRFRRSHPDVDLQTREIDMDKLPDLVAKGEIDVGYVRMPMDLPAGVDSRTILEDRFCLALPVDHPLAVQRDDPTAEQIAGEPLVVPEQLAGTYEVARRGGFIPNIVASPGLMSAVLIEVSFGTGVAIVPNSVCDAVRLPQLTYRPLSGPAIASSVAAIFIDAAGPVARAFIDQLTSRQFG